MKNALKTLGIIALVTVIGFSMTACGGGVGGGSNNDIPNNPPSGSGDVKYNQITFVEARKDKGFNYGYFYYIPSSIQNQSKKYLLVEPNNSPYANDDLDYHKEMAQGTMQYVQLNFSSKIGCATLVPVFPRPDVIESNPYSFDPETLKMDPAELYVHALTRYVLQQEKDGDHGDLVRVDLQLIKIIEDLMEKCESAGIKLEAKFLMDGFSASGNFVNRFTAIHPELVQAVVSGGVNCMPILPADTKDDNRLIYPVGIADLEELTGAPFNLEQYKKVPQFIYMGAEDNNDTYPYDTCFGSKERSIIKAVLGEDLHGRWQPSINIYEEQGCSAVIFKKYPGVGHTSNNSGIQNDVIAFLKNNMK